MLTTLNLNINQTFQTFFKLKEKHHFHLVDNSQLPINTAFGSMILVLAIVFYLHPDKVLDVHYFDNGALQIA